MSEEQKKILEKQLWAIANLLRGKMDADDYRNYILGFIFFKYLSEKLHIYADEILEPDNISYEQLDENSDAHSTLIEAVKKSCIKNLGYFLKPSELFTSIAQKGNNLSEIKTNDNDEATQFFIIEDLERILTNIEQSTMGTESEDDFVRLFEDLDLTSSKLGKTLKAKNEIIAKIITHLDNIDFQLKDSESDLLGDAYEYLIGEFASSAGKKAGEFYTPQQVSTILAKIVTTRKKRIKSVYDPTCGSGSLLLRVAKEVDDVGMFYGQELNRTTYNLARMNMILHDVHFSKFDIKQEDTLEEPQHISIDLKAEAIVANPPFSANWSAKGIFSTDDRFSQYGKLAPKTKADFAFVQHMIHHLDDNGIMATVLPHGVLFRDSSEGHIRKYLIEDRNYIDAVIGLPPNIFFGTTTSTCILVVKKCREVNEDILFIDASKEFEKQGSQNKLLSIHIDKIIDTYENRKVIDKFSYRASLEEVRKNSFNLNIPRYIDVFSEDANLDINISSRYLSELKKLSEINDCKLKAYCETLSIPFPEGYNTFFLKQYKEDVMKQIFSQKIRFKDNTFPNWRKGRIDDFGYFYYGKSAPKFSLSEDAPTPCVRYGELYNTYNEVISKIKSYTNIEPKNLKFSKGGEVLIPRVGENPMDFANCSYLTLSNVAIGEMISVYNTKENGLFITYYFNSMLRKKFARVVEGGNVSNLYYKYLCDIQIEIPCLKEQNVIIEFLKAIDYKINHIELEVNGVEEYDNKNLE